MVSVFRQAGTSGSAGKAASVHRTFTLTFTFTFTFTFT
jgi:hypothetical protein